MALHDHEEKAIAANTQHAGIILIAPSFRTDEFAAIAQGIEQIARSYPGGLAGSLVYIIRTQR